MPRAGTSCRNLLRTRGLMTVGLQTIVIAGAGLKHLPPTLSAAPRRIKERLYLQADSSNGLA
jgi:hypothetical protein